MDLAMVAALAALALVDSTSFGTLGIPVVMLAQPRVRGRAFATYLITICAFYAALGLILLAGASWLVAAVAHAADLEPLRWAQVAVGIGLVAASFLVDRRGTAWRRRRREARGLPPRPDRHQQWRSRVLGEQADTRAVAGVALLAGLVEAASMLPYLGAISLLSASGLPPVGKTVILLGYVLVMALPATLLLALRLVAAEAVAPLLRRIDAWTTRNSEEILGWTMGIVGFLLVADGWSRLS
ncbi:MAG: GAP family protein [Austwickia sp.]|jgi:hypothetical protein|nr:GAP family protein [Austwickia sp.]MBK8437586.1 GAP family protein [Austwickia sp.]MBK9102852.1 GAP family protein [Austwickia sp.]